MTQQDTEAKKLGRFITSLNAPNHIILLYDDPLDIETLKDEAEAREYGELEAPGAKGDETSQVTDAIPPLFIRRVEEELADLDALLREERRIEERGQENSII